MLRRQIGPPSPTSFQQQQSCNNATYILYKYCSGKKTRAIPPKTKQVPPLPPPPPIVTRRAYKGIIYLPQGESYTAGTCVHSMVQQQQQQQKSRQTRRMFYCRTIRALDKVSVISVNTSCSCYSSTIIGANSFHHVSIRRATVFARTNQHAPPFG